MQKIIDLAILAVVLATVGTTVLTSQQAAPLHDSQYPDADIAYGASLYTARCVTCHGAQGDAIGGVNLRSGTFRNAVIDRDLARFIRAGSPAGMPPFALDNAEMAGIIAYLRNMNSFDTATVKTGDAARGRAVFDGKGGCASCHRVGRAGSRVAPNLSDIGAARSAGSLQRSLARSDQPDDADQPAGARRHEGRHRHQRPAAQRGHLQPAAHRRPRASALAA